MGTMGTITIIEETVSDLEGSMVVTSVNHCVPKNKIYEKTYKVYPEEYAQTKQNKTLGLVSGKVT